MSVCLCVVLGNEFRTLHIRGKCCPLNYVPSPFYWPNFLGGWDDGCVLSGAAKAEESFSPLFRLCIASLPWHSHLGSFEGPSETPGEVT